MPEGAPTSAFGERSGAPSGLRPSSFVMCNTPVEVQFMTSAGCLNYPCRTPQANDVASDGTGRNSPFAAALLHNLSTPDLDLRQMLFNVQDEVDRLTAGKQRPELSISLVGQYKLKPATTGAP